jgi:hypothetical protein
MSDLLKSLELVPIHLAAVSFCVLVPMITFDLFDAILSLAKCGRNYRFNRKFSRNGNRVISNTLHRVSTAVMAIGNLSIFILASALQAEYFKTISSFVYTSHISLFEYGIARVAGTWSCLYFLQLVPGIGKFVIGFQRMMMACFQFLSVFLTIFSSFAFAFKHLLRLDCTKSTFTGDMQAFYNTFLMMLNMVNLNEYKIKTLYVAQVLHVAFIIIVTILLVNFLIALMSSKHSEMTEYGDFIFRLYRLDVAVTVERRLARLGTLLKGKCLKDRKMVKWIKRKCLNDGKIVVTIVRSGK